MTKSEPASSNASSGTKRKRKDEIKYYAVRAGQQPGVYHSWADCLAQVKGFKNAAYKSFPTLTEAEAFVNTEPAPKSTAASTEPKKFYAVQSGRVPGVYTEWPEAQKQVVGWTKPKHKSFPTRAEAEAFVAAGASSGASVSNVTVEGDTQPAKKNGPPPSKKVKKSQDSAASDQNSTVTFEPGTGPLPPDAEDGFDPSIILDKQSGKIVAKSSAQLEARKQHPTGNMKEPGALLRIYTDGSSLGNGKKGAVAGVGVFFGPNDKRNLSEPLAGARQTNQRAELTAVQRALDVAPLDRPVLIYSDSSYAINCVTVWYKNWRKNNWINSSKKPVENRDIVEAIVNKIEERQEHANVETKFEWLKGHANDPGNVAADHLAVNGARIARQTLSQESVDTA